METKNPLVMELTFEKLPEAVAGLISKLDRIERLIKEQGNSSHPDEDQLLTVQEAATLLNLSVPTIYGYVNRAEIPVCKKSKRLYFSKQQLTDWIKQGRKKTNDEIAAEASAFLSSKKRRG
jgi:excisionase family DNA binding protein